MRHATVLFAVLFLLLLVVPGSDQARGARPYRYPWPFQPSDQPHPVANLYHTPLRPGTPRAYFHGGIDIRKPRGTKVLAVADGTVAVYREGMWDNLLLTQADGRTWEYRHLKADSVPEEVRKAAKLKTAIKTGTVIGEVGAWDGPYDHLHLNRRQADGKIVDPLFELLPVKDTKPAEITGIHFVADGKDQPFEAGEDGVVEVSGKVDIVVTAIDRMDGEEWGNPPSMFHLRIGKDGKLRQYRPFVGGLPIDPVLPVPRYPRGESLCVYLMTGTLSCFNGIPGNPKQRFSIVITNVEAPPSPMQNGCWDTRELPDGLHPVRIRTRDRGGNWTDASVEVRVKNGD